MYLEFMCLYYFLNVFFYLYNQYKVKNIHTIVSQHYVQVFLYYIVLSYCNDILVTLILHKDNGDISIVFEHFRDRSTTSQH